MAREITQFAQDMLTSRDIKVKRTLTIDSVDQSAYFVSGVTSFSSKFGSASGVFILNNNDGRFGVGGSAEIKVGDVVEYSQYYENDTIEYKKFYGIVEQRSIEKRVGNRNITINCLDYISILKTWDIDLVVEGTRVRVENEILDPVYLDAPNDDMAQLFNFANDSIAPLPIPSIKIKDQTHEFVDPQYDGFEIYYDVGQLKLGCPLQVQTNYEVEANYYYYVHGVYAEDVLEDIFTQVDGYGNYLFGESSAQAVIDNHLTTNLYAVEGTNIDTMTPNYSSTDITIETTLVYAYDPDASGSNTTLYLVSTSGLPESGTGSINGDLFTWTSKGSNNTLEGIPLTGAYALNSHAAGSYVEYEATYAAGQVWYLGYDNLTTNTLSTSDFTLPLGVSVQYVQNKRGRIILDASIPTSTIVTCNTNYSFKTLQATGIELNRIAFRPRELKNAYEAIGKLRNYLAPNYIIRTEGDNKIWASYLEQKTTQDYTLELIGGINYLEDEDLYTRVILYGKNNNPTNIMFEDAIAFTEDESQTYTGIATKEELFYIGREKAGILSTAAQAELSQIDLPYAAETASIDLNFLNTLKEMYIDKDYGSQPPTGYHIFTTPISGRGSIILGDITPIVYINNVPIDNEVHQMVSIPMKIRLKTTTTTSGGGKSKSVSVHTYYYYSIIFPHTSIVPSESIYLYDANGILVYTIDPNNPDMDYGNGVATVPGNEQSDLVESFSTATYWVNYSTDLLEIDYENIVFKIDNSLLPYPEDVTVTATFEYWATIIPVRDIDSVVDGRRDTQIQLKFFGEPPSGYEVGIIDLGSTKNVQAIDLVGGFFKPDEFRKFDVNFRLSLYYSLDNVVYTAISDKADNFEVGGGEAISFEENDLGMGFEARYIKILIQSVDKIEYGRGVYVVALTDFAMYDDIILKGEATLIATTALTAEASTGDTTVTVTSTAGFTEPESSEIHTAYIGTNSFTYTGLTATTFTGCTIESGISGLVGDRVSQTLETSTTLYDDDGLLPNLKDRIYKEQKISDRNLYDQTKLNTLSKAYLKEFYKNHSKVTVDVVYAPHLKMGQTILLVDAANGINSRYFIESIKDTNGKLGLVLAKYPGDEYDL